MAEQIFTFKSLNKETGEFLDVNISEVLDMSKDMWKTSSGVNVISLRGFQKLAKHENIVEKKIETACTPTEDNKQMTVVNLWVGRKGDSDTDNWCRGSGEASRYNTGKLVEKANPDGTKSTTYVELTQVDACFRYAIAEKRAYCRGVQKILGLEGVYADVEAAAFSKEALNSGSIDY